MYTVRIILLLVGLAFQDYKDFFIFLPPHPSLSRAAASFSSSFFQMIGALVVLLSDPR